MRSASIRKAIVAFRRTLELRPGHAGAHNNLGMALNALGETDEAIEQFRAALAAEPRFVAAQFNLGNTLDAAGRYDEAARAFEAVLTLQPHLPPALFGLGNALAAAGQPCARAAALRAGDRPRSEVRLRVARARTTHQALGAHAAALRAFDEALRLRPDLASAHMHRAVTLLAPRRFRTRSAGV